MTLGPTRSFGRPRRKWISGTLQVISKTVNSRGGEEFSTGGNPSWRCVRLEPHRWRRLFRRTRIRIPTALRIVTDGGLIRDRRFRSGRVHPRCWLCSAGALVALALLLREHLLRHTPVPLPLTCWITLRNPKAVGDLSNSPFSIHYRLTLTLTGYCGASIHFFVIGSGK